MLITYAETLEYLYKSLPMFQRIGAAAYKADLVNTTALCAALGDPHRKFKSVHVAGTNGKGSSSHMIAAILQSGGYKTGLYTSPHLKEFTERIRINGAEVDQQFVVDFVNKLQLVIENMHPSFFEMNVAMAFDYFASRQVDIAVIEVGLGGRLDSTNVISPEVSLITNISFDHKDLLGETLPKIAFEKAGIIKRHTPVVISERQSEVEKVFNEVATSRDAELTFADEVISVQRGISGYNVFKKGELWLENIVPELKGEYQQKNIPGVLATVLKLRSLGFTIPDQAVRCGIEQVTKLTGLKGRWQVISNAPLTICDTGHNQAGIAEVLKQIGKTPHRHLHFVFGVVKDKDVTDILKMLPKDASYYFCAAKIPRAMDAITLKELAASEGLMGQAFDDVNDAVRAAHGDAAADDMVFIGGSTFVVAEVDGL
ncbi:MAG TPA: folylpolyglutamate synthase/dihydrofolate synthase family protein [Cyclobacteriaceae bacterium]|nr:folylpolyglutamate synthase/dihydrofolate synthase family protein [Cyclobacteriaceae bacterium]